MSVSLGKKKISIKPEGNGAVLEMTNEYGNSIRFEISDNRSFDGLFASVWQFIKDSQH